MKRFWIQRDAFERLLLIVLAFVTLFALLPWQPQGPFDARDWSRIEGVSVTLPWWQMVIEPFTALGHIITGAPDFRLAAFSLLAWLALSSPLWVVWRSGQRHWWRRGLWAVAVMLYSLWLLPAYLLFFSHLHFPGWRLELDEQRWLVADLQSHTLGSHDALVRADESLAWHAARGYGVVAVTEHDDPAGAFYAEQLSREVDGPLVIPGIEMANEYNGFLLALGLQPDAGIPGLRQLDEANYSRRFTQTISEQHHGAVISMAWRLRPEDVVALTDAGVHAFELINVGHPDIPDAVRQQMLQLERQGRVRLVSSTDWHGWGGNTRSWTLLAKPQDASALSREELTAHIIRLLREGQGDEVVPVVAGYQGEVGSWRFVLTPLVEAARYAAELSPLRLLGWWMWGALLWLAARRLRRSGYAPGGVLWSVSLLGMSALLLWRGTALYLTQPQGDVVLSDVTEELGEMAIYAALLPLVISTWQLWRLLRKKSGTTP